jgi:hypothetical protein
MQMKFCFPPPLDAAQELRRGLDASFRIGGVYRPQFCPSHQLMSETVKREEGQSSSY